MVALPVATPVTTPELFTVAIAVLLLLHVPPVAVSDKVTVEPRHTDEGPVMAPAFGRALIVIAEVAETVPQLLVLE